MSAPDPAAASVHDDHAAIKAEVVALLGPDWFSPTAIATDGSYVPYDLTPARKRLRDALAIVRIVQTRRARFADERSERGTDNRNDEERTLDALLEALDAAS